MKLKITLFLLIISVALFGNSIFSRFGLPIQYYGNDVYGYGMGETGVSDLFRVNTNYHNPSLTASASKVLFSTSISMGYQWYLDNQNNSFRNDGLSFPYFTIAVPVKNHRIGFSFNSYASGNLDTQYEGPVQDYPELEITATSRISSNIFKADLMYANRNRYANIGVSLNYYLGNYYNYYKTDFADPDYIDVKNEYEKLFKHPGFTVGLSKKVNNFSLGATYSSAVDLVGDYKFKYNHAPGTDTLGINQTYYQIPQKISGGVTWKFAERYKVSFDAYYEMWNELDGYDKNTLKTALGVAYDPLKGYGKWYERIPLRAGGYIRELPFEANNEKIMESAVTFGSSIPLKSPDKRIDLGAKYLVRGDAAKHDYEDNSLTFYIGITGFDIFAKRVKKTGPRDIPEADPDMR